MSIYWIARYNDGTSLKQNGTEASYKDIDRDRLIAFDLVHNDQLLIQVDLRDDSYGDPDIGPRRLIWRLRHQQTNKGHKATLHMVGWQRKIKGRNVQSICYVNEDGQIVMSGQWQDDQPMMHAIKPWAWETDLHNG